MVGSSSGKQKGTILVRETTNNTFVEETSNIIVHKGMQHPRANLRHWTTSELSAIGLYFVDRVPVPEDYVSTGYHFEKNNDGKVVQVHDLEPYVPHHEDVNNERDRRISLGVIAMTSTGKSVPMDTRVGYKNDVDFRNISGMSSAAIANLDNEELTFTYRGADNQDYELTPQEAVEVGMQAMQHVDAHYKASWQIKDALDSETLEVNYKDDSLWP